jgi:hypothetical protein
VFVVFSDVVSIRQLSPENLGSCIGLDSDRAASRPLVTTPFTLKTTRFSERLSHVD